MTKSSLTSLEPRTVRSSTVTIARSVSSQSVNTVSRPISENVRSSFGVIPRRESPPSSGSMPIQ